MSTIKTTIKEYSVIQHMALQQKIRTGKPVLIQAEHKRGGIMVTAPADFLRQLGF